MNDGVREGGCRGKPAAVPLPRMRSRTCRPSACVHAQPGGRLAERPAISRGAIRDFDEGHRAWGRGDGATPCLHLQAGHLTGNALIFNAGWRIVWSRFFGRYELKPPDELMPRLVSSDRMKSLLI